MRRPISQALPIFLAGFLAAGFGLSAPVAPARAHAPLNETLSRMDGLIRQAPRDADLYFRRAQLRELAGQTAAAEADLDAALALAPTLRRDVDRVRARWRGSPLAAEPTVAQPGGASAGVSSTADPGLADRLRSFVGRLAGGRLAPTAPAIATVTRGPYLMMAAPTGMTIRWRTSEATDTRVRYGLVAGALDQTATTPAYTTEHELRLTGLAPATRYYYAVGSSTGDLAGDATCTFLTPPPAGTEMRSRLWILGDSGDPLYSPSVRNGYVAYNGALDCDLWLMLGDNAYSSGTDAEYQAAVFNVFPTLLRRSPLWPTRGNHEIEQVGGFNPYYDIFSMPTAAEAGGDSSHTEAWYSFDYANAHFICLDSQGSDRTPAGPMLTWLVRDLGHTSQPWVIAFWHHPPYSKGSHDSDTDTGGVQQAMRQNALPILEAAGVDLVLTGHSHSYERSCLLDEHYGLSTTLVDSMKVDPGNGRVLGTGAYVKPTPGRAPHEGAVYAVVGSSSRLGGGTLNHPVMIASLNVLGSLVLDLDGLRLDGAFIGTGGQVLDNFTLFKGAVGGASEPPRPAAAFRLLPPTPNPARGPTRLGWTQSRTERISLTIVDVQGRVIARLLDELRGPGTHETRWNGHADAGGRAPAGVYLAVLNAAGRVTARRLVTLP